MSTARDSVLLQALALSATERASLIDDLIGSLDQGNMAFAPEWLAEAEARLAAYDAGEDEAIDAEQVFAAMSIC